MHLLAVSYPFHSPALIIVKKSLSYSGAVLWNSLPFDIRQSPSLDEFKSKLMNYHFDSRCTPNCNNVVLEKSKKQKAK